jgi:DNA-binding MarR family transcriptional regulator
MEKENIFECIQCMSALIRADKHKICADLRLQLIHFEVLDYLSYSNQYTDTPAATASYFGMTRGTVSQSLIVLEKKGYIEKNKDSIDKRIIHVHLLPLGLAILKKARRTKLFNKATLLLKQNTPDPIHKKQFITVLNALQKASLSPSFTNGKENRFYPMKQPTVFDLIEYMSALIRSEERKRCSELKIQLVHFQILKYLSSCNKYSDTPAAIANYLGITRGTVSQTLLILEKKEFIRKNQDDNDKRVYHILLLDKGHNTLKKTKPTELFNKASKLLKSDASVMENADIFVKALTALQKANNSYSFGICKTCKNFTKISSGFFCELTQEKLSKSDSEQICQEHVTI